MLCFKKERFHIFTGQEDGADEIKSFPSMQEIGEDLVNILDTLRVKVVIGLGEGITRFIYTYIIRYGIGKFFLKLPPF